MSRPICMIFGILQRHCGGWWRWALVSPDGVAPSQMVGVSASVNLPLHHKVQKFCSGTGSLGWSRKKGCKTIECVCVCVCATPLCSEHLIIPIKFGANKINNLAFCLWSQTRPLHSISHSYGHFYAVLFWTSLLSSFSSTFLQSDATCWKTTTRFPLLRNKYRLC